MPTPVTFPDSTSAASLLDAKSTGGIRAWNGFAVQYRYTALRIPGWLNDPHFTWFQSERLEDVDVGFDHGVGDHYQVKTASHSAADVRNLIAEFRVRNADRIRERRVGRYILACAHLTTIRGFADALEFYERAHFEPSDDALRQRTLDDLRARASKLELDEHIDFILDHVRFDQDLAGLESGDAGRDRLAVQLGALLGFDGIDEGKAIADALLKALSEEPHRRWQRADLDAVFARQRETYRRGPPRPAGELIAFRHETLKPVDVEPDASDLPEIFRERRVNHVGSDGVARMKLDAAAIEGVAADLVAADGAYLTALRDREARILYFGFPHVPFAMLAGFLAQAHRDVAVVEHDLDTGRFGWRALEVATVPPAVVTEIGNGRAARVRISVSANVVVSACAAVLPDAETAVDLHVAAVTVGRGKVDADAQAKLYASALRDVLDSRVAGNDEIDSLHVFAAVPVSVAFRIGQVLAHTSLPKSFIYNFDSAATPRYCWRLCLQDAAAGRRSVDVLGSK